MELNVLWFNSNEHFSGVKKCFRFTLLMSDESVGIVYFPHHFVCLQLYGSFVWLPAIWEHLYTH